MNQAQVSQKKNFFGDQSELVCMIYLAADTAFWGVFSKQRPDKGYVMKKFGELAATLVIIVAVLFFSSGQLVSSAEAAGKPQVKLTVCKVFTKGGRLKYTYKRQGINLSLNGRKTNDQLGPWPGTTVPGIQKIEFGKKVRYFFVGLKKNKAGSGAVKGPFTHNASSPDSRYRAGKQHGMTYKCDVGLVANGKTVD